MVETLLGHLARCRREQIKLAVVYVGRGQEREAEILANTEGSQDYEEFVASLGWPVRVRKKGKGDSTG